MCMYSYLEFLDNVTLSIELSTSWTNISVTINIILTDSSVPSLNQGVIWKDPNQTVFYPWAGQVSDIAIDYPPPPLKLWRFAVNGAGGSWSQVPESSTTFNTLVRQARGWGLTVGDTGYYLGGILSSLSDPSAGSTATSMSMITSLNFTSGAWSKDLRIDLNSQGTVIGQKVLAITALGLDQRDLLVLIGGYDPDCSSCGNSSYTYFSNITIYDPYIDLWLAQQATGPAPAPREAFCAVAIKGDNGTYEM